MRLLLLSIAFVLAACAGGEPLPPIQGQWIALNPHLWKPTPDEQRTIQALPEHD